MSKDDFVVLRMENAKKVLGGSASVVPGTPLTVNAVSLGPGDLRDVSRESDVIGVAKSMPVLLVKPFDSGDVESANGTWGLEAVGALSSHRTGAGATVAVLDTGIDADHEAFAGKEIDQQDFTGEGNGDQNGHGTHCAGTVFGGEVDGTRIGVAPGIEKALIGKVLDKDGRGSTKQILEGLLWAAQNGANVISVSLGLDFPGLVEQLVKIQEFEIQEATSMALDAYRQNVRLFDSVAGLIRARSAMFSNTIVVAAAGNESRRPRFEIATAPPAAADGFMAVGALGRTAAASNSDLVVADFSNSGPAVSAPGVSILSAKVGGGLVVLSGTSMATPHVAGVAALWVEELADDNPNFKVGELEGSLTGRAEKSVFASGIDPDDRGAGLVQSPQT